MVMPTERPTYKCQYTGKIYRGVQWHLRSCEQCNNDKQQGKYHPIPIEPQAEATLPDEVHPPHLTEPPPAEKVIEIDLGDGSAPVKQAVTPEMPRFAPTVEKQLVKEALSQQYFTDDTLAYIFRAPIDILTSEGGEVAQRPSLTDEQTKLMVQLWRGPINQALMSIAGKKPELVIAFVATLIIYGPPLIASVKWRTQKRTRQAAPEKKMEQSPQKQNAVTQEDLQNAFEKALKGKGA